MVLLKFNKSLIAKHDRNMHKLDFSVFLWVFLLLTPAQNKLCTSNGRYGGRVIGAVIVKAALAPAA